MLQLIGILLPALIDVINKKVDNSYARFWVSVGVCSIVGLLVNFIDTNGWNSYILPKHYAEGISESILQVFGIAQLVYKAVYDGSPLQDKIKSI